MRHFGRTKLAASTALAVAFATAGGIAAAAQGDTHRSAGTSHSSTGARTLASAAAAGGTLSIAPQGPVETFNPWVAPAGNNNDLVWMDAVYDTLLHQLPSGKVVPSLAKSFTQVNKYTIKMVLQKGVKFDNGQPVNARAVQANFNYANSQQSPGTCNAYIAGVKVQVTGPLSFTLHMKTPNPDILPEIATCAGFVVNPVALKNPASLTTTPDGSGPYKYEKAQTVPNSKWVFVKRPHYWDASLYPFKTLTVNYIPNTTAADNAARAGQVNFLFIVAPNDTSSGLALYRSKPDQLRGLAIADLRGATVKPLGNMLVRQAMNYAINRKAILDSIFNGKGVVDGCSCTWNDTMPGYSAKLNSFYNYDPAKARQLLAKAGYPHGFSFTAMDSPSDQNQALLQAISGYLSKIGIQMTVSPNMTTFIPTMLSGKSPAFYENWTITPFAYYNVDGTFGPTAFWNPLHITSPLIAADLRKDLTAYAPAAVTKAYTKTAYDFARAAWYVSPVDVETTSAYNAKQLSLNEVAGAASPFLYNFQLPKK